jgi:hypothetical protein
MQGGSRIGKKEYGERERGGERERVEERRGEREGRYRE